MRPFAPTRPMGFVEFVAFTALMFASVAFAIDSMLPMLVQMGEELSPDAPHRAQLVIASFVFGMGLGTLFIGPVSDAFGRRRVIVAGIALYMLAASVGALSTDLDTLLAARFVQGLGVAAPRVVTQALVRDQYAGRMMARLMSFSMTLFVLVPAIAPLMGATLGALFGWRAIFWSFLAFGAVSGLWLLLRQPETLPPERRVPLRLRAVLAAFGEVFGHRQVMAYLAALTFSFAAMFVWLSSVALVFDDVYDRADSFPLWFALSALLSAPGSLLNARLVMRLGMRRLVFTALSIQLVLVSVVGAGLLTMGGVPFALFFAFMVGHFFTIGLIFGNLNALALEPLGHVAGTASSVMGGVSTMFAASVAAPLTAVYDGTIVPLVAGAGLCAALSMAAMLVARRWD